MKISSISGFVYQPRISTMQTNKTEVSFRGDDRDFDEKIVKMFERLQEGKLGDERKEELLGMMDDPRFDPNAHYWKENFLGGSESSRPIMQLLFDSKEDTSAFVAKIALHPKYDFNDDGYGKCPREYIIREAQHDKGKEFSALLENNPFVKVVLPYAIKRLGNHENIIDHLRAYNAPHQNGSSLPATRALEKYHLEGGREEALKRYNEANDTNLAIKDDLKPTPNEFFAYEIRKPTPDAKKLREFIDNENFDPNEACVISRSAKSLGTPLQALFSLRDRSAFFLISTLVRKPGFDPTATSYIVSPDLEKSRPLNVLEGVVRNNDSNNTAKLEHFLTMARTNGVEVNVTNVPVFNHKVRRTPSLIEFAKQLGNTGAAAVLQEHAEKTGQMQKEEG